MNNGTRLLAIFVIAVVLLYFVWPSLFSFVSFGPSVPPFRLGLDLLGGTHLVYEADLTGVEGDERGDSMEGVRDVIERRVNLFGVAEPVVQIEGDSRLVVELAGIQDVNEAIAAIGETPFLEFKEERTTEEREKLYAELVSADDEQFGAIGQAVLCSPINVDALSLFIVTYGQDPCYVETGLTGKYLERSRLEFDSRTGIPQVSLNLNGEGGDLFKEITQRNVGKTLSIYIDGLPITPPPVVQTVIDSGKAVISGGLTVDAARELTNRLNAGALPVPVTLVSQQTIGASLGSESLSKSLTAAIYGLVAVAIFMILFYRLPGMVAVVALGMYVLIVLAVYKLFPVTLTLAGIAGFILSLGMAVDANVLIFERFREERRAGKGLLPAFVNGFSRAWQSIRDGHVTTLLGAFVLYIFTTSLVKGFALTLGIGVLISLLTSVVITRMLLKVFMRQSLENKPWLF